MATFRGAIPEVPYSQWEITSEEILGENALELFFADVSAVRAVFLATFPPAQEEISSASYPSPAIPRKAPQRASGYFCPEHGVPVQLTAPQYNPTGEKYYHPLPQSEHYRNEHGTIVKNCNKWLSQVVTEDMLEAAPF